MGTDLSGAIPRYGLMEGDRHGKVRCPLIDGMQLHPNGQPVLTTNEQELARFGCLIDAVVFFADDGNPQIPEGFPPRFVKADGMAGMAIFTDRRVVGTVLRGNLFGQKINHPRDQMAGVFELPYDMVGSIELETKTALLGGVKAKGLSLFSLLPYFAHLTLEVVAETTIEREGSKVRDLPDRFLDIAEAIARASLPLAEPDRRASIERFLSSRTPTTTEEGNLIVEFGPEQESDSHGVPSGGIQALGGESMSTCPNCGATGSGEFCTKCGTPVSGFTPTEPSTGCATCEMPLDADAAFCTECGTPVAATTPEAPTDQTQPPTEDPYPATSTVAAATIAAATTPEPKTPDLETAIGPSAGCATCDAPLDADAAFCTECGTPVAATTPGPPPEPDNEVEASPPLVAATAAAAAITAPEPEPEDAAATASAKEEPTPCTTCDAPLATDAAFCTECGTPVAATTLEAPADQTPPPKDPYPATSTVAAPTIAAATTPEPTTPDPETAIGPSTGCATCDAPLDADAAFCTECGTPVAATTVPPLSQGSSGERGETATDNDDASLAAGIAATAAAGMAANEVLSSAVPSSAHQEDAGPGPADDIRPRSEPPDAAEPAEPASEGDSAQAGQTAGGLDDPSIAGGVAAVTDDTPTTPSQRVDTPVTARCPRCGSDIDVGSHFCLHCGAAQTPTATPPPTLQTLPPPDPTTISTARAMPQATCTNCRSRLEPGADFCVVCGTPTAGSAPAAAVPVPTATKKRPYRTAALVLAIVVLLAVAAAGIYWLWPSEDDSVASPTPTTSSQPTSTTIESGNGSTPDVPIGSATDCDGVEEGAVSAVDDFSTAVGGSSPTVLAAIARSEPSSLPGASSYRQAATQVASQAADLGCPNADLAGAVDAAAATNTAKSASRNLVWQMAGDAWLGNPNDLIDDAAIALAARPNPNAAPVTTTPPAAADEDLPKWIVMLASMSTSEYSESDATTRAQGFTDQGAPAEVIATNEYASLTPDYWAVSTGRYDDRTEAIEACDSLDSSGIGPGCYHRYLQVWPSTDAPFGRCGPYGLAAVGGVSAGGTLAVRSRPNVESTEVAVLAATDTAVLLAGEPVEVTGLWSPVAVDDIIGWVQSRFLTADATCAAPTGTIAFATCQEVADATTTLLADASDETGAAVPLNDAQLASNDMQAGALVAAAASLNCDKNELNELVAVSRAWVSPNSRFAERTADYLFAVGLKWK